MLALGLQGSPRKKGNTEILLDLFMSELAGQGFDTHVVEVCRRNIEPCKELTVCEKKGICPIHDDMESDIYGLLRQADLIIAASPVFFYNVTAQLKALIDRCQALWARKYMLKLNDPGHRIRRGFLLSVAATAGKQLFDGLNLTAKYFFDAVAADFKGSLTYRRMESRGQIKSHPSLQADVAQAAAQLAEGLTQRPKILFACRENACRSQMAAAFARIKSGDRLDVVSAGSQPAGQINPLMVEVMQEKGIDMGFLSPRSLDQALAGRPPQTIVTMGCGEQCPYVSGARRLDWDLSDPAGQSIEVMRAVRDEIESKVDAFIDTLK
ncbi:MAG: NAD(P)H-dependent oxidoreductase [Desulfobacteraceae bacterium]|nr:NAD(P)H-dependent oxidoreductase [Desulfobacteraceae bacterium]